MTALVFIALTPSCSAKLKGNLTVDGQAFKMESCRSGEVYGFAGVELSNKSGGRLRLASMPNGQAATFYFPPGAKNGIELGSCGTFEIKPQNSEINGVKNVEGNGMLDCKRGKHHVKGDVRFANCH